MCFLCTYSSISPPNVIISTLSIYASLSNYYLFCFSLFLSFPGLNLLSFASPLLFFLSFFFSLSHTHTLFFHSFSHSLSLSLTLSFFSPSLSLSLFFSPSPPFFSPSHCLFFFFSSTLSLSLPLSLSPSAFRLFRSQVRTTCEASSKECSVLLHLSESKINSPHQNLGCVRDELRWSTYYVFLPFCLQSFLILKVLLIVLQMLISISTDLIFFFLFFAIPTLSFF